MAQILLSSAENVWLSDGSQSSLWFASLTLSRISAIQSGNHSPTHPLIEHLDCPFQAAETVQDMT